MAWCIPTVFFFTFWNMWNFFEIKFSINVFLLFFAFWPAAGGNFCYFCAPVRFFAGSGSDFRVSRMWNFLNFKKFHIFRTFPDWSMWKFSKKITYRGVKIKTPPKKTKPPLQKFMRFLAKIKPRAENLKLAREARQKIFRVFDRIARGKREKRWSKRVQISAKILAKPPKFWDFLAKIKPRFQNCQILTLRGGVYFYPSGTRHFHKQFQLKYCLAF